MFNWNILGAQFYIFHKHSPTRSTWEAQLLTPVSNWRHRRLINGFSNWFDIFWSSNSRWFSFLLWTCWHISTLFEHFHPILDCIHMRKIPTLFRILLSKLRLGILVWIQSVVCTNYKNILFILPRHFWMHRPYPSELPVFFFNDVILFLKLRH